MTPLIQVVQAAPPPSVNTNSVTQRTNGTALADIALTVSHPQGHNVKLKIFRAVKTGGACQNETYTLKPTLSELGSDIVASVTPAPDVENDNVYQVGTVTPILTSSANSLQLVWNAAADVMGEQEICLAFTPADPDEEGNTKYQSILVDRLAPSGLTALTSSSQTNNAVTLNWSSVTETNFNHYEIWYGTNQADVQNRSGAALEWDDTDDNQLRLINRTSTVITGLLATTAYFFKIWAVDNLGNESTVADISISTTAISDQQGAGSSPRHSRPSPQGESGKEKQGAVKRLIIPHGAKRFNPELNIKINLGDHRDRATVKIINDLLQEKRPLKNKESIAKELRESSQKDQVVSMSQIENNPNLRNNIEKLAQQDPELRKLLRGHQSDRLILQVWQTGDRTEPVAEIKLATNLFGEVKNIKLPLLPEGNYDFTLQKPFGIRQSIENVSIDQFLDLYFSKPLAVGDLNGDGKINRFDFQDFLDNFKKNYAEPNNFDFNEDGILDLQDFSDMLKGSRQAP